MPRGGQYGWRIASAEAAGVHFQETLEEGAGGSRSGKGGRKKWRQQQT